MTRTEVGTLHTLTGTTCEASVACTEPRCAVAGASPGALLEAMRRVSGRCLVCPSFARGAILRRAVSGEGPLRITRTCVTSAARPMSAATVGALCDNAAQEQAEACGNLERRGHGKVRAKPVLHTAVLQRPSAQLVAMAKAACFMVAKQSSS